MKHTSCVVTITLLTKMLAVVYTLKVFVLLSGGYKLHSIKVLHFRTQTSALKEAGQIVEVPS